MSTFEAMGLNPALLSGLDKLGFETPTPIQAKAIPFILRDKRDLVALAQTGTGKTGAFGIPLIQYIDPGNRDVQAIILCPTRELCLQIAEDLAGFARDMQRLSVVAVYGGSPIHKQVQQLRRGAHIVVGTPGRTLDLIRRRDLYIDNIEWLVLDEADEMLNRGFKHDLDAILASTPQDRRTLLFSATMPSEIARIARDYLYEPERISVGQLNASASKVSHYFYQTEQSGRYRFLRSILDMHQDMYGIIFCRTKRKAREVARRLRRDRYSADAIEGDMSQPSRDRVMKRFKSGNTRILVATDVAARGVDVNDLTHVINFNLPDEDAVYIHRSGRTGRAGRSGIAMSIISADENSRIRSLEKLAKKNFQRRYLEDGPVVPKNEPDPPKSDSTPSSKTHQEFPAADQFQFPDTKSPSQENQGPQKSKYNRRLSQLIEVVLMTEPEDDRIDDYMPEMLEQVGDLTREQLLRRFVAYAAQDGLPDLAQVVKGKVPKEDFGGKGKKKKHRNNRRRRF